MTLTSESAEQTLPPLLALPVELQLEIISHLPHDEYPSRACLRRTHTSFLQLIPKSDIRSNLTDTELFAQLLKTELEYAYLFPPDHYPCYFCAAVQPLAAFATRLTPSVPSPFEDYRVCCDCRMHKRKSYRRSFIESFIWIGCIFEELPTPPSRPLLRLPSTSTVRIMPNSLERYLEALKQQARDPSAVSQELSGRVSE